MNENIKREPIKKLNNYYRHYAIQCLNCNDIVYSRARHDYRSCGCGACAIDGGLDYYKVSGFNFKPVKLKIWMPKKDLYFDWYYGFNRFGIIKAKK